jgi:hypothetical protein
MLNLELRFHPNEIYFPCTPDFKLIDKLENSIVYYKEEDYTYEGISYKSISYLINYIYNSAIGCGYCFCPQKESLGFHNIDRERVKVLFDKESNEPKYVYFSAHSIEDKWYPYEQCEKNNNNLVIYVSLGSHANYPSSGTWFRIFGFANDKCSKKGKKVVPKLEKLESYSHNPSEKDKNSFKLRFFLPFYI